MHLEKPAFFYLHGRSSDARIRHRQKAYGPYIPKIQFLDRGKLKFLLQGPSNSMEHKVRNSMILTFTVFIDYTPGKTCFLCPRMP
jgi:hypothetical protein